MGGMIGDPGQDVGQPGLRVDVVQLGRSRPALHARKLRYLELKAGHKSARGQKGTAHAYNLKSQRDQERRWVEQGETAYARFVAGWNARGPKARTGAAKEERQ